MKNKMMVAALLMVMILTGCGNRVPLKTAYEEADLSALDNQDLGYILTYFLNTHQITEVRK